MIRAPLDAKVGRRAQPRLLVVEDEWLLRSHLAQELRDAGFVVVEAMSAEEAMLLLGTDTNFALMITDVRMEGAMSGLDLAKWVRRNTPDVRIAIASANLGSAEQRYDAVFSKPYEVSTIIGTILTLLASPLNEGEVEI